MKTLHFVVAGARRGNRHGYMPADYARDAVVDIERRLAAAGRLSWSETDPMAEAIEHDAVDAARDLIAQCDPLWRDLITVEVVTIED